MSNYPRGVGFAIKLNHARLFSRVRLKSGKEIEFSSIVSKNYIEAFRFDYFADWEIVGIIHSSEIASISYAR